jgi:serine/threonine-protein kinase
MVLAAGGDLRQMRGAPYTKILPLLIDIAAALEHAHRARIVHRDLKPSNILLDARAARCSRTSARAHPKATTLGSAGLAVLRESAAARRRTGAAADDIYGLGALAYELLSGYPPFYPAFDAKKIATEPVPRLKPVKPIPPRLELLVFVVCGQAGSRASRRRCALSPTR